MAKREKEVFGPRQPSDIDSTIGRNVKTLRLLANLSQQEVGTILGVTFQQVQKYESGSNRLPLAMLFKLKNTYGVSWDRFFTGLEDDTPPAHAIGDFDEQTIRLCRRIAAISDAGLRRKIGKIIEVLDSAA